MRGLVGVLLLVIPLYTAWVFLSVDEPGENAFGWWLVGLFMVAVPWGAVAIFGFVGCLALRAGRD